MKRFIFNTAFLLFCLAAFGQGKVDSVRLVDPEDFPLLSSINDSNFNFFTRKNDVNSRAVPSVVRAFMQAGLGDSVRLEKLQDSILVLTWNGVEVDRDTVPLSKYGGTGTAGTGGNLGIQALKAPNTFDSLNIVTNQGTRGVTIEDIVDKANVQNQNSLKATEQNRLGKTLLQPSGVLASVNRAVSWNVRDNANALLVLTEPSRLLPPISLEPGGSYTLTVRQGSTPKQLSFDGSVYHLSDTVSTLRHSSTTFEFVSPDGKNLFQSGSVVPSDVDVALSDFYDDIEIAMIPSIIENNWLEGLSQFPKSTMVNMLDSAFFVTKDRSRNGYDIYHGASPPTAGSHWEVQREDGKVCVETDAATAWRVRDSEHLTTVHSGHFTLDVWAKRSQDTGSPPILAVGSGSASQNGFRLRVTTNVLQFTIGDGDGSYAFSHNHPNSFTVSDGWERIIVVGDTVGPDSIHIIFKGVKSGDVFTPVPLSEMSNEILMAYDGTGVSWSGWLGNLFLFNRELSQTELDMIGAIDQSSLQLGTQGWKLGRPLLPGNIDGLEWSHDWSSHAGRLWQDDAKSIAADADGDPVRRSEAVVGNLKNKEFTAPSDGVRPAWQDGVVGTKGALYFDSLDIFQVDGYSTVKQLTGDFTIVGMCRPDTLSQRVFLSDGIGHFVQVSAPDTIVGGGGRIHTGQVHLRMKGPEYGDYKSTYGGLTARVPRGEGDWFVFALTKRDTNYSLTVNNTYHSTATKGDAEGVGFWEIGGTGTNTFKGWVTELHKYGKALSNSVRDTLLFSIADKYGISIPSRTDETFDESRIEVFAPSGPDIDYVSFGQPMVLQGETASHRDTCFWVGSVDAFHNGQVSPNNSNNRSGIYLIIFDEHGFIDSVRVYRDRLSDTLDARQSAAAAFWGRDSILVLGTFAKYVPGDTTITADNGYVEFRQRYRWVNWRNKTLGPVQNLDHPVWDSTQLYLSTGIYLVDRDTFHVSGYAANPGGDSYHGNLIGTTNGGNSFTNILTIDPSAGDFSYIGIDGNSYTPTSGDIDPEECKIIRMANGSYCFTIRNDFDDGSTAEDDQGFYMYTSPDINDWSSAELRHGFVGGKSMPNITDVNGYLYVSQREDFIEYKSYVWRSIDFGRSWQRLGQVDHERADAFGVEDMYGGVVELNGGLYIVRSAAKRTTNGGDCDLSLFPLGGIKKD